MVLCALICIYLYSAGACFVGIPTYCPNGIFDVPSILKYDVLLGSYDLKCLDTLY